MSTDWRSGTAAGSICLSACLYYFQSLLTSQHFPQIIHTIVLHNKNLGVCWCEILHTGCLYCHCGTDTVSAPSTLDPQFYSLPAITYSNDTAVRTGGLQGERKITTVILYHQYNDYQLIVMIFSHLKRIISTSITLEY